MKRFACLLVLGLLSVPAQALQLIVWDRDLQTKLGYGEAVSGKLNLQLVGDYSGPIVMLVAREGSEKTLYSSLQSRYDGMLKNSQLGLKDEQGQTVNLAKLLAGYKITLNIQNAAQSVSLPGLKSGADSKAKNP